MRAAVDAHDRLVLVARIGAQEVLRHGVLAVDLVAGHVIVLPLLEAELREGVFLAVLKPRLAQARQVRTAQLTVLVAHVRAAKDGFRALRLDALIELQGARGAARRPLQGVKDRVEQRVVLLRHPLVEHLRGVVGQLDKQVPRALPVIERVPELELPVEDFRDGMLLADQIDVFLSQRASAHRQAQRKQQRKEPFHDVHLL